MWTSQNAMDLKIPVPTIDAAVAMRDLSCLEEERRAASRLLPGSGQRLSVARETFLPELRNALYAAMIITFAQGMALLRAASRAYGYGVHLETVARIWRGGCIVRAALLDLIRQAFRGQPDLPNLLLDADLTSEVASRTPDLRMVVCRAASSGIPAPAFSASLAYLDGYGSAELPGNLIQAQRDYFGAHTYERVDQRGVFHTVWRKV
jgi:6-phosphogluconate dehydrogenase